MQFLTNEGLIVSDVTDREFGRIEAKVEELEAKMDAVQITLNEISKTLSEAKGGWKTLVVVGSVSGAIGAFAAKVVGMFGNR